MKRLNKSNLPFLILTIIHTTLLILSFMKSRDRKRTFVLLMSDIGLAYLFEYIVLNLFNAYKYQPKILRTNYIDNILGAILSQGIFVPFASTFIRTFHLGWQGKAFFTVYFYIIETLFLKIKVYKVYWWRKYYTSLFLPIFFNMSDFWKKHVTKGTDVILFLSLFLCILVTGVNLMYIMAVVRKFRFGIGKVHSWKEHFVLAPLYSIVLSLLSAVTVLKKGLLPKGIFLALVSFLDWLIYKTRLVKKNFNISWFNLMVHCIMLYISTIYKKIIYHSD